jgi:hypothetical protein
MPTSTSYDDADRIVFVIALGDVTYAEHCAARDDASKYIKQNGCVRLLVNLKDLNTDHSSTLNFFKFGESLAYAYPNINIAVVLPVNPKAKGDVQFITTVNVNRGANVKEFDVFSEARDWLLSENTIA